jgi:hypothetical protein
MSGIATGTALLIGGGLAAGGSLGAAGLESSAAGKAASTQANAADYAANIQGQLGQESLANEEQTQQQNQANEEPFLQTGANSLASLGYLLGITPGGTVGGGTATPGQTLSIPGVKGSVNMPGVTPLTGTANTNLGALGSLMEAYPGGTFTAPTAAQAEQTPGYQFALNQGEKAVQSGASANGSLLTGGTLNAEQQFGQGLADTNYNNTYNQALGTYNTNYNTWANNQANQFNRLAAVAGMGQTSAQTLGTQGIQSAGQIANTLTNTGQQLGTDFQNAGAATASGYMGAANAWGGGISGATNSLSQMAMLQQLMQNNQSNPYSPSNPIPQAPPSMYASM